MILDIKEIEQKYSMTGDFHTHTVYSCRMGYKHGKGLIKENVGVAAKLGLSEIAITDHGPGHKLYGMDIRRIPQMRNDIAEAEGLFPDTKIYLGVEANIINTENGLDVTREQFGLFDFVIAGYHYGLPKGYMIRNSICSHVGLTSGSTEQLRFLNTEMTVRALTENRVKIITHPGDKGPFDMKEISQACEKTGTMMEISTRHTHLTVDEIKIAADYDVKFVIDSDAHRPCEIGNYAGGIARAQEAGLDISRIVNIKERNVTA